MRAAINPAIAIAKIAPVSGSDTSTGAQPLSAGAGAGVHVPLLPPLLLLELLVCAASGIVVRQASAHTGNMAAIRRNAWIMVPPLTDSAPTENAIRR